MSELLQAILDSEEKNDLRSLISELRKQEKNICCEMTSSICTVNTARSTKSQNSFTKPRTWVS